MLTLREEQMEAFRRQAIEGFENDMLKSIAMDHPAKYQLLGEVELRKLIRRAIESATAQGIQTKGAVGVWIELTVQFGEGFVLSPDRAWAHQILAHPKLPDYIKMDILRQRMTSRMGGRTLMPAQKPGQDAAVPQSDSKPQDLDIRQGKPNA